MCAKAEKAGEKAEATLKKKAGEQKKFDFRALMMNKEEEEDEDMEKIEIALPDKSDDDEDERTSTRSSLSLLQLQLTMRGLRSLRLLSKLVTLWVRCAGKHGATAMEKRLVTTKMMCLKV